MQTALTISIGAYLVVMFGVALWAQRHIKDEGDFIVAGRRLPVSLASATLLATWFGAGTLLTAADEIRAEGLRVAALEPYGAGLCLIVAGLFFAKPLWEMKIYTIADLYREKFGPVTEQITVVLTVPSFMSWIAVQLIAVAGILDLLLGVPMTTGVVSVALVAMLYTLLGGMWSVTLTDAIQLILVMIGLVVLSVSVFTDISLGGVLAAVEPKDRILIPRENAAEFFGWLSLLTVAVLGNIPSQDLGQRIFASKSSAVARRACLIAGLLYVGFGTIPVLLGLAGKFALGDDVRQSVLPALALKFFSPAMTVIFVLTLLSVVLSTIDSAILAPASVLARNTLRRIIPEEKVSTLTLCHISVVAITAFSVWMALSGKKAFELLEQSYALGLVGFFVPFMAGIWLNRRSEGAAIASIAAGMGVWSVEFFVETSLPMPLLALAASLVAYLAWAYLILPAPKKAA
ncbi:MAG: sodium:solute symporter family protein [Elusimicrobiota bacterium]